MADFVSVLRRAVGNLENNSEAARHAIYSRARNALRAQLEAIDPPLSEQDISLQTDALDRAVSVVEAEFAPARPDPGLDIEDLLRSETAPPEPVPPAPAPRAPASSPSASSPSATAPSAAVSPAPVRPAPVPPAPVVSAPHPPAAAQPSPAAPAARPTPAAASSADPSPVAADSRPRPRASFQEAVAETGSLGTAASAAARQARDTLERIGSDAPANGAARVEPAIPVPPPPRGRPAPSVRGNAAPAAPAQIYDEDDGPERGGTGRVVAWIILFLVLAGIAAVGFWQRDTVMEVVASLRDEDGAVDVADNGKISDRLPGGSAEEETGETGETSQTGTDVVNPAAAPPPAAVTPAPGAQTPAAPAPPSADSEGARPAQALLIEENPGGVTPASTLGGSVEWSLVDDTEAVGGVDKVIRGDVTVPEKGLSLTVTMRRNADAALPASHLIELVFSTDSTFDHGGIASIPGIIMKATPRSTGQPLVGAVVPVMDSYFLVGLSESELDRARNVDELKARDFIDVPIAYKDGGRAVLSLAKGESGKGVFEQAFAAWGQ